MSFTHMAVWLKLLPTLLPTVSFRCQRHGLASTHCALAAWSGRKLAHWGYFIKDPGWNIFDIFLGAGCDCEEDCCWCTILTASRKGHPMEFFIKLWRSWIPSQQWDKSKPRQPVRCWLAAE